MNDTLQMQIESLPQRHAGAQLAAYRNLLRARARIDLSPGGDLDMESLARSARLSSFEFARLFKSAFGETPSRYIRHRRLTRARFLLMVTPLPVSQIARECGFRTLEEFEATFSRAHGQSALMYRAAASMD